MPFETLDQGVAALRASIRAECQAEENSLYLPLLGKRFASSEAATEDLESSVRGFTANTNPKRVCALFGEGGSGKSSFLKQFTLKLLEEYLPGTPIPLFVSLPLLTDPIHAAVEETLKKIGFNEAQIVKLKENNSFIFIFDGYDEIHQLQNLYVSNRLSEWNAKTIISCRAQYFYNKENPTLYFMPIENELRQPHLLQTLYVAPFNQEQIQHYFTAIQPQHGVVPNYEEAVAIPGLQELITSPFLLKLTVEALPEILSRHTAASSSSSEEHQRLTQTDLHKIFVRRWFERQEIKLKASGHITADMPDQKPIFWRYCQSLALEMHRHNLSWLNADDESFSVYFENDVETEMLRSACPVQKTEDKIGFWHESLGMHFVSQTIYQESLHEKSTSVLQKLSTVSESFTAQSIGQEKPQDTIHLRLITDDLAALRDLADEVNRDHRYKAWLFNIIERSKTNEYYAVGAANAISVLNAAKINFSYINFENIRVNDANLTGMTAFKTRFHGADLSRCYLGGSYLAEADFNNAILRDVKWGEEPGVTWPSGSITQIIFSSDNRYLIVSGDPKTVVIYNTETNEIIQNYTVMERVLSIDFSLNGQFLLLGLSNGSISIRHTLHNHSQQILPEEKVMNNSPSFRSSNPVAFDREGKIIFYQSGKGIVIDDEHLASRKVVIFLQEIETVEKISFSNNKEIFSFMHKGIYMRDGKRIRGTFIPEINGYFPVPKKIQIWNILENRQLHVLDGYDFCLSPDGKLIVIFKIRPNQKDLLDIYDIANGGLIKQIELFQITNSKEHFSEVMRAPISLAIGIGSACQIILATGHDNGSIFLWDLFSSSVTPITRLYGHKARITALAFTYRSERFLLASGAGRFELQEGGGDCLVRQWDIEAILNGYNERRNFDHESISALLVASSLLQIVSSDLNGVMKRWCTSNGMYLGKINGLLPNSVPCIFNNILYFLNYKHELQQYDLKNGQQSIINNFKYEKISDSRICLAISADGKKLAINTYLENTQAYDLDTGEILFIFVDKEKIPIFRISFSTDHTNQYLFLFGSNVLFVFDMKRRALLHKLEKEYQQSGVGYGALSVHPLNPHKFTISQNTIILKNSNGTGYYGDLHYLMQARMKLDKVEGNIYPLDERQRFVSDFILKQEGSILSIDIKEQKRLGIFFNKFSNASCSEFSPDGKFLVAGYYNGEIIIWDAQHPINEYYRHVYIIRCGSKQTILPTHIAFLDEQSFLIGRSDGTIQAWRLNTNDKSSIIAELIWLHSSELCLYSAGFSEESTLTKKDKLLINSKTGNSKEKYNHSLLRNNLLNLSTKYLSTDNFFFHEKTKKEVQDLQSILDGNEYFYDEQLNIILESTISDEYVRDKYFKEMLESPLARQSVFSNSSSLAAESCKNKQVALQKSENKRCVIS